MILALLIILFLMPRTNDQIKTMLCLGDSYTIGQGVHEHERFPVQTVEILNAKEMQFSKPEIIAKTGWTTQHLIDAIKQKNIHESFDIVTLLIGVNDEYDGMSIELYEENFKELLQTAIHYVGENKYHVFVLSIPDWGVYFEPGNWRMSASKRISYCFSSEIISSIDRFE